jgi:hypothetical protein
VTTERRYVAFLKADAATEAGVSPSHALLAEMLGLMSEIAAEGALVAGDGLKPSAHGARIVSSQGKVRVIDGPFAETKELVAGVGVYRTSSVARVIEWARRMLEIHLRGTRGAAGEVEIRELVDLLEA